MFRGILCCSFVLLCLVTICVAGPNPNCTNGGQSTYDYWQDCITNRQASQAAVTDHMSSHCTDPGTCSASPSLGYLLDELDYAYAAEDEAESTWDFHVEVICVDGCS